MKKACERLRTIRDRLGAPIDGASLAAFRILFGALLAFAMIRFLAKGWVGELYVRPSVFFPYEWLPWVKPLPLIAMHLLFVALAILGACVALGFHYRISLGLFLIGFTYVELIDKTTYLNHYYLISLLCGLMCFLPCHRMWSIDAWLRPSIRTDYAPRWTVDLLRFQFAAVYVFAGLAKLTPDWLLSAQPLRIWLAARNDLPAIGPLLDEGWVAYVASWSGAAYDLAIVPLLLHRKTRRIAFGLVVAFHLGTAILFRIGMFPWLMIIGTLLFFSPGWSRRWMKTSSPAPAIPLLPARPMAVGTLVFVSLYVAAQLALPLRAFLQPEPSGWTFHGFNWSWRVMLVEKTGQVEFRAVDPISGGRQHFRATDYLTPRQAGFVAQDPEMIRALARHIAAELRQKGHRNIQVFADAYVSFNGRPARLMMDPAVDLAASASGTGIFSCRQ
ncbi:MAG TPA: HTTM domain-containing protein [Verrucomicrobiae bacterium]|nr:HTTM domain-containing protein [Verrucomicrobiae bacterium]